MPATAATGHLPDYENLPEDVLNRTAVAYICSPANPQGAVASRDYWTRLIQLAEKYDFRIFADECYSEIYRDEAPVGALTVAQELGADPERVVLFNSLSKRSNLPGLRSGLIAGGPETIKRVKQLRAYSGAPLPGPLQAAAARVWADEAHVVENRALYQEKYKIADEVFDGLNGYMAPEAGFFLWLPVENGEQAALKLWKETGVRVLPGAYLAQGATGTESGRDLHPGGAGRPRRGHPQSAEHAARLSLLNSAERPLAGGRAAKTKNGQARDPAVNSGAGANETELR